MGTPTPPEVMATRAVPYCFTRGRILSSTGSSPVTELMIGFPRPKVKAFSRACGFRLSRQSGISTVSFTVWATRENQRFIDPEGGHADDQDIRPGLGLFQGLLADGFHIPDFIASFNGPLPKGLIRSPIKTVGRPSPIITSLPCGLFTIVSISSCIHPRLNSLEIRNPKQIQTIECSKIQNDKPSFR